MATTPFGSGRLDKLLDIIFTKQVTYVGAKTFPMWDMIKSKKASDPLARAVRFRIQTELGFPAAGAGRNPGAASYAFPRAVLANVNEFEGEYKLKATTVGLTYDLYRQAQLAKSAKALEPLALEMTSKAIAEARILAAEFWLDGTGVRGQALSADDTNLTSAVAAPGYPFPYSTVITLNDTDGAQGHANCFEYGDVLVAYPQNGSAQINPVGPTPGTGTGQFYGWKVADRDRRAQTVTLQPVDTNMTVLTTATASNIVATNVFYRVDGQQTFANLASVADYGTATEIMPGIESLAANDGRLVFGMQMSGILARSEFNAQTQPLDVLMIDEALGEAKNRMGEGRFSYKQMLMDDFSHRQMIDSRETDRRFISYQDNVRGTSYMGYQHRADLVRAVVDEYVRRRVWLLPEDVTGEKVLEYHGTDWENVSLPKGGSMFFNPTTDGRYTNQMVSFKSQRGVLINRVPGGIACVRNYTTTV